jgi:MoCo/4Fe-4S cofactor protein with predicted Tat translocation signal
MEPRSEQKYWSSLAQFNNDPEFIQKAQKEFQSSPLQEEEGKAEKGLVELSRRDFMKLMAASTALASSACFQKPAHKILPYVNQPEEITFGIANFYASTCGECSSGCGTLVKTREGRPIKIEGNPDHPMNKGGLCARGQASILNLYDPDRLRNPISLIRGSINNTPTDWPTVDKKLGERFQAIKANGGKIRILSDSINSPSTLKLIGAFLKGFSHGEHIMYDSVNHGEIALGQEASYGTKVVPRYRFDKADVIVSIDADFLGTWLSPVEFTKQFSHTRKLDKGQKKISKLITFESSMSITGSNADERFPIRPQDGAAVALALVSELSGRSSVPGEATETVKQFSSEKVAALIGCDPSIFKKVADQLWAARGKSLVVAGTTQGQNDLGLTTQVAVNLLNSVLGNDGATIDYKNSPSLQNVGNGKDLTKLIKDMNDGQVDALLIYRSNPAYNLPKDSGFKESVKKVKELVISFNDRIDETALVSDYVLPDNHPLESWGDAEPQKNLFSLIQPTIRPIYDTRSFGDSLLAISKAAGIKSAPIDGAHDFHEFVQNNWKETIFKEYGMITGFDLFWESALRDGVFDGAGKKNLRDINSASRAFKGSALKNNVPKEKKNEGYTLSLYTKVSLGDGARANNAWLQELPDPISRMTWDNYASISNVTAEQFHLKNGDLIKVKIGGDTIELPAHVQPGLHDKVIAVALGYGREQAGSVGNDIGKNMFPYQSGSNVSFTKTGATYILASAQEHDYIEGRPIVREATLKDYLENPHAGNEEKEALTTIWSGHEYKGYRWAMSIDLNSCTGCQACVIGCQSENNIPVVGKDGVFRGRIMHWMRIDRYYTGTPDSPKSIVHQPMLCQHCENAPCETVCPVIATMHDDEGLNVQVYNRCVGTRYCANNCPYKVRRFNWFEYNYGGQIRYPINLSQNPEVTVRSRGVMEKCTFCVQRIADAKNTAKNMGRKVRDGELKTACQQSCPADAIQFGDINNSDSEVTRLAKDPRGYHVLDELNTRPSINYLTKIRNTETS